MRVGWGIFRYTQHTHTHQMGWMKKKKRGKVETVESIARDGGGRRAEINILDIQFTYFS